MYKLKVKVSKAVCGEKLVVCRPVSQLSALMCVYLLCSVLVCLVVVCYKFPVLTTQGTFSYRRTWSKSRSLVIRRNICGRCWDLMRTPSFSIIDSKPPSYYGEPIECTALYAPTAPTDPPRLRRAPIQPSNITKGYLVNGKHFLPGNVGRVLCNQANYTECCIQFIVFAHRLIGADTLQTILVCTMVISQENCTTTQITTKASPEKFPNTPSLLVWTFDAYLSLAPLLQQRALGWRCCPSLWRGAIARHAFSLQEPEQEPTSETQPQ